MLLIKDWEERAGRPGTEAEWAWHYARETARFGGKNLGQHAHVMQPFLIAETRGVEFRRPIYPTDRKILESKVWNEPLLYERIKDFKPPAEYKPREWLGKDLPTSTRAERAEQRRALKKGLPKAMDFVTEKGEQMRDEISAFKKEKKRGVRLNKSLPSNYKAPFDLPRPATPLSSAEGERFRPLTEVSMQSGLYSAQHSGSVSQMRSSGTARPRVSFQDPPLKQPSDQQRTSPPSDDQRLSSDALARFNQQQSREKYHAGSPTETVRGSPEPRRIGAYEVSR